MKSDAQLLRDYAEQADEAAFREIVARHADLVYSSALRQVDSPDLARDVAQNIFADLARKAGPVAGNLSEQSSLAGWLYRGTRFAALGLRRQELRRHLRERQAMEPLTPIPEPEPDWEHLRPMLDEAMADLSDTDRDALLLRFFKNHDLRAVGAALGLSADAAQKRVSRALEKLRESLSRRGITTGAGALTVILSANAVQAAPVGLAVSIAGTAMLSGATVTTAATVSATATKIIAMTTLQKTFITTALVAAVGTGIYQARQVSNLRNQVQALQQQQTEKVHQLERERDEAAMELALLRDENESLKSNTTELARLRGEVTRLRGAAQDSSKLRVANRSATNGAVSPGTPTSENVLPRDSWADAGFTTPQEALRTRGWAVLNGNRERFKESVFVTDAARKILEDMFVKMAEASKDTNKAQYIQQILDNNYGVEDAILMPLMALNRDKNFTGYRILSEQSPSENERVLQVETQMASAPAQKETLKFRNIDGSWKVVIDEEFIKAAR
jgi:RNA polymerase sigma factor (sigma-70 family)